MDRELLERQKEIEGKKKLAPKPLAAKEIAAAAGTKNVLTSAAVETSSIVIVEQQAL